MKKKFDERSETRSVSRELAFAGLVEETTQPVECERRLYKKRLGLSDVEIDRILEK